MAWIESWQLCAYAWNFDFVKRFLCYHVGGPRPFGRWGAPKLPAPKDEEAGQGGRHEMGQPHEGAPTKIGPAVGEGSGHRPHILSVPNPGCGLRRIFSLHHPKVPYLAPKLVFGK